jgi:hypothetical protein
VPGLSSLSAPLDTCASKAAPASPIPEKQKSRRLGSASVFMVVTHSGRTVAPCQQNTAWRGSRQAFGLPGASLGSLRHVRLHGQASREERRKVPRLVNLSSGSAVYPTAATENVGSNPAVPTEKYLSHLKRKAVKGVPGNGRASRLATAPVCYTARGPKPLRVRLPLLPLL